MIMCSFLSEKKKKKKKKHPSSSLLFFANKNGQECSLSLKCNRIQPTMHGVCVSCRRKSSSSQQMQEVEESSKCESSTPQTDCNHVVVISYARFSFFLSFLFVSVSSSRGQ
jgi:hypothetical protein